MSYVCTFVCLLACLNLRKKGKEIFDVFSLLSILLSSVPS